MKWNYNKDYLIFFNENKLNKNGKIASFDLDWTLIKPKSGNKLPKDFDDWDLLNKNIIKKLKYFNDEGYQLIIFSNQSKLKKKDLIPKFKLKIENICKLLPKNIQVYISTNTGYYRKPFTGLWDEMIKLNKISFINASTFYCGDAAGRVDNWEKGKKKDFACSDRMFAHNIGILFYEPEVIFLNNSESSKWIMEKLALDKYIRDYDIDSMKFSKDKVILLCVGYPGSGKSSLSKKIFEKYNNFKIINQDKIGNKNKCLKECEKLVEEGFNIIIDNTNYDINTRKKFIDIAIKYKMKIECLHFDCKEKYANHMNHYRCQESKGKYDLVPIITYRIYNKNYTAPSINEGFSKIIHIPFSIDSNINKKFLNFIYF